MVILIIIAVLLLVVIILFAFPQFSPIPYFPSNAKDVPLILKTLNLRNNQTIIDLGAGDGIVIFKGAEKAFQDKLNTQFIAVEINPVLLLILHIRRLLHPNRANIRILRQDMFTMSYADLTDSTGSTDLTIYIYISPWFIEKTIKNIERQLPSFNVVSYFYPVKCLPEYKEEVKEGVHKVYSYTAK